MRRLFTLVIVLAVISAVAASSALADTYSFKLNREGRINGTTLEAGKYTVEVDGNGEAHIYKGKELVTKASAQVKPRTNGATSGSVLIDAQGNILEVRTKKEVVVFVR